MARNYNVTPSEFTLRSGMAGTVEMQLRKGTVGFDVTNIGTVELHVRDKSGGSVVYSTADSSPTISKVWPAAGSVNWILGTTAIVSGSAPYRAYFKLRWSPTIQEFCPEDSEITIDCREVF